VVRACKGDVLKRLQAGERELGLTGTLLAHCRVMQGDNKLLRALAASRISRYAGAAGLSKAADRDLLSCLLSVLRKTREQTLARPVARAAAHLAPVLGREQELIQLLEASELEAVRSAGHGALWANGRAKILGSLAVVLKRDPSPAVRLAVVQGFGDGKPWTAAERRRVCPLLLPLVADSDLQLAAAAASRVASGCPEHQDRVIDAAEKMLAAGNLDLAYINAVHGLEDSSPDQKRRIAAFYTAVVGGSFPPLVRSTALRNLHQLDPAAGTALARRHRHDPAYFVTATAKKILEK
jgi:hypothetical protein